MRNIKTSPTRTRQASVVTVAIKSRLTYAFVTIGICTNLIHFSYQHQSYSKREAFTSRDAVDSHDIQLFRQTVRCRHEQYTSHEHPVHQSKVRIAPSVISQAAKMAARVLPQKNRHHFLLESPLFCWFFARLPGARFGTTGPRVVPKNTTSSLSGDLSDKFTNNKLRTNGRIHYESNILMATLEAQHTARTDHNESDCSRTAFYEFPHLTFFNKTILH